MQHPFVSLARLATDSGGRYSERTNELGRGFVKAQRDLACHYSVGFLDESAEEDRAKDVVVRVRRPGLRAIHPSAYVHRSARAKRESLLRAAYLTPEMFETGVVRAHLFPLRPTAAGSWEALLAVSFPVPLAGTRGGVAEREFGAVLWNGSIVAHRFFRKIRLEPKDAAVTSEPMVTFLERVSLPPGTYGVTAVIADSVTAEPQSAKVQVEVPQIPRRDLFLVSPVLGRRADADVVVRSGGSSPQTGMPLATADAIGNGKTFQPLLVQQLDAPTDLFALTQVCIVGRERKRGPSTVGRWLRTADGAAVGSFEPIEVQFEGKDKIRCQSLVDLLPSRSVSREAAYLFEAAIEPARSEGAERGQVRFSVGATAR